MNSKAAPMLRWLKLSFISLLILAFAGTLLRYKIIFSLPLIDQKHLLHSHSHFAFAGWLSQTLMVLLVAYLVRQGQTTAFKKYHYVLLANLLSAYGMLIGFLYQGYGLFSITCSTTSIIIAYVFTVKFWKDCNQIREKKISSHWFKMGLFLHCFSSLGAFALTLLMAGKVFNQEAYLAAQYFYLHFEYNGWFFFICMGFATDMLLARKCREDILNLIFRLFAFAVIPAYFLSALWMKLPAVVYVLVILAAFLQIIGWQKMFKLVYSVKPIKLNKLQHWLFFMALVAFSIKVCLQLASTIPLLSTWAFGYRPIVIGYLHLAFLAMISLFIIGYLIAENHLPRSTYFNYGAGIFAAGIILNEALLLLQGLGALTEKPLPFLQQSLLGAALVMLIGAAAMGLVLATRKTRPVLNP